MASFLGDVTFNGDVKTLLFPQVITATTNGTGVDVGNLTGTGLNAMVQLGAGTGTGTIDVKLQESDVLGSGYTDIPGAAFTTLVVANVNTSYEVFTQKSTKRFVRAVATVGGTVSFSIAAILYGQLRNSGNSAGFATGN